MPIVTHSVLLSEAILVMTAKAFGCVGVVGNDGALAGIVTDGDLRRHMAENLLELEVNQVMTNAPKTIRPDALGAEAIWLMNQNSITSLFVAENDKPIGILHMHDCLRSEIT